MARSISGERPQDVEVAQQTEREARLQHENARLKKLVGELDLPPVIRPPVLLVRMLQEPVADSPRRCGAGRDYRSAASVQ